MSLETTANLAADTVAKLQDLIRANIDAYDGLRESAEEINDPSIATLFRGLAAERSRLATELQDYVEWNSKAAADDGSFAAGVHRAWINVRSKLNSGDPYVVLIEAEFGEDHIKHAYEDVLKETAGSAMNSVLLKQYAVVKAGHDRVRDLRDMYAHRK
jgi:uncharacterized protein (TIGR02284 family)